MKYKIFKINNFIGLALLILTFLPSTIFSASISVSSGDKVFAGDTSIIEVYLNTEGQNINTVDGSVILSDTHNGNFEIRDLNTVNSVFPMWPRKPSLGDGHKISFSGGVPNGVNGSHLLLFKIVVKINESGDFKITPENLVAYLNDGLGTSINITKEISTIVIGEKKEEIQDKWKEIVSNDNNAPAPFVIELIQDANLYDGKKFISFEATDAESGISHYEVREGNYPSVRTGNTYVLIDQSSEVDVIVTAYDKAGNFQVITFKQKEPIHWMNIFVTLLIILIIYKIIKRRRKNKNKTKINVE